MNKNIKRKVFDFLFNHLNKEKPEVLPIGYIQNELNDAGVIVTSHELGKLMSELGNPHEKKYEWFGLYRRKITLYQIVRSGLESTP